MSQGKYFHPRLDIFLHHYLQFKTMEVVPIKKLYYSFCEYWNLERNRNVSETLEELVQFGNMFTNIIKGNINDRVKIFSKRFTALDTTTVYPVLFKLLIEEKRQTLQDDLGGIITDLESYLIRRMICELPTKNYNKFFISILQKISNLDRIDRETVRRLLLEPKGKAGIWPNDHDFKTAWMEYSAYSNARRTRCKMILRAIDDFLKPSMSELISINDKLTVEHILPQSWRSTKISESNESLTESDENSALYRDHLIHTIGNLTLITKELNSSIGNLNFDEKRKAILEHSLLPVNTYFRNVHDWNEEEIKKRSKNLFEHALKIWPFPTFGHS